MEIKKPLVFLGGSTMRGHFWRDQYSGHKEFNIFNPWVSNWTPKDQAIEDKMKKDSDVVLFTLAGTNLYSISEVTACAILRPETTILILDEEFMNTLPAKERGRLKSLYKIRDDVRHFGAHVFTDHQAAVNFLISNAAYLLTQAIIDKQRMQVFFAKNSQ